MGGRVEGKRKKKSVKAKVTSKFSSKRKLSRMGKKVKAGLAGPNTNFMTRSAVLRKLQITLKDFRRLCILKGIYPRVPTKALSGKDKIYYDIKDISYIMQDSLLSKFREFKAFMKKIRRCAGRKQYSEARRKDEFKPLLKLDHIVKERYPRFIDALRDLDDPLCMIHLFAALPSVGRITTEHTQKCAKLVSYWNNYIIQSKTLTKTFISIKGIYFQAEIMGEQVTWLTPHAFTQHLPKEVDFRVMLTFLEFYEVFMNFVLFKLYNTLNLSYPPQISEAESVLAISNSQASKSNSKKAEIDENLTNQVKEILDSNEQNEDDENDDDDDEEEEELGEALTKPLSEALESQASLETKTFTGVEYSHHQLLFENLVFFVNREVPMNTISLCIRAFGGQIGWDDSAHGNRTSPFAVTDTKITHQIIDRPVQEKDLIPGREYIQPQWVFDSINAKILLPTRLYAVGQKLPPHLSPFVDDEREGYIPTYKQEINKLKGITSNTDEKNDFSGKIIAGEYDPNKSKKKMAVDQDDNVDNSDEDDESGSEQENDDDEESNDSDENDDDDASDEEEEDEVEEEPVKPVKSNNKKENNTKSNKAQKQKQVEAKDLPTEDTKKVQKGTKAIVYDTKSKNTKKSEEQELKELSMQMMPKKKKILYDKMQHGIEKKQEAIERLELKRKLHESKEKDKVPSKHQTSNEAKRLRKK